MGGWGAELLSPEGRKTYETFPCGRVALGCGGGSGLGGHLRLGRESSGGTVRDVVVGELKAGDMKPLGADVAVTGGAAEGDGARAICIEYAANGPTVLEEEERVREEKWKDRGEGERLPGRE